MSSQDYDASFITEALPAFVSEAHEHIRSLEDLLLQLEGDPRDRELLDALFRAAHTIKGSAGIFGIDPVVAFTHHVEALLEQVRAGRREFTPELGTLLLACNDQIRVLVDAAGKPSAEDADAIAAREALVVRLKAAYGADATTNAAAPGATAPQSAGATRRPGGLWRIDVTFGTELFRNGMDPLAILSYLASFGEILEPTCDPDRIPSLEEMDPESCHLAMSFGFRTTEDLERIEAAFSFVRDDCELSIAPVEPSPAAAAPGAAPDLPAKAEALPVAVDGDDRVPQVARAPSPGRLAQEPSPSGGREATARPAGGEDARYIRVQADRLDNVINLLGELVIASAGASLLARLSGQSSLIESTQQIAGLVEEIRNGTLQLRMVPIGDTFARFRRVVRDTAAELGKDIVLDVVGAETELDKSVVERIVDPLMHLVRNALDHGLETPEQRVAAGKAAQGRLTLAACHESGSIVIRIVDDGRGIDRQRVLQRARERGLVPPDVLPTDEEIVNLIFQPGFSTAEKVTKLSGRGVGMDVVRSNIEALRGTVAISSEQGAGSTIEIRLPLTLAIIDGFLVSVGTSKFIFPLDSVIEVLESRHTALRPDVRGRTVTELRGQLLPVVNLRTLYELDSDAPDRSSVVVIQSGTMRLGVMVDTLLGQHQTVIKPLTRIFAGLRGISGSTILGNGEVALIFDVGALGELASENTHTHGKTSSEKETT